MRRALAAFLIVPVFAFAQEPEGEEVTAERQYEHEIRKIFQEYTKTYIPSAKWNSLIQQLGSETYTIRKNDTLWGISETLFGDGFYWPKVWSFNPKISNPHKITEGDTIRFDYGDYKNPPKIELVRGADVVIPEPETISVPLVKELPSTVPIDKLDKGLRSVGDLGFVAKMKLQENLVPTVRLKSFYAEAYPSAIGEVSELLPSRNRAGLGDTVYVSVSEGQAGDVYSVIGKESLSLGSYDPSREREVEGVVVDVLGEIRLGDLVNESENLFRATVMTSLGQMQVGSQVIRGRIPRIDLSKKGRTVRIQAVVIGGGGFRNRRVMGLGDTIFLSVGESDGLRKGDVVTIMANERKRAKGETRVEVGHRKLGRATVVKTESTVSTAVITQSSEEVASGDITL